MSDGTSAYIFAKLFKVLADVKSGKEFDVAKIARTFASESMKYDFCWEDMRVDDDLVSLGLRQECGNAGCNEANDYAIGIYYPETECLDCGFEVIWKNLLTPTQQIGQDTSMDVNDKLVRLADAAEILAVSEDALRRWINIGRLDSVRMGASVRLKQSTIQAILDGELVIPK